MAKYATGTTVTASQTQGEIMGMLGKRGSTRIGTLVEPGAYSIAFEYGGVTYRIDLPLPDPEDPKFTECYKGSVLCARTENAAQELYEKELNRRWRAFGAVIKAKIIATEEGISTMEREFIGNAVLPSGRTVAESYADNLPKALSGGQFGALALPGGKG